MEAMRKHTGRQKPQSVALLAALLALWLAFPAVGRGQDVEAAPSLNVTITLLNETDSTHKIGEGFRGGIRISVTDHQQRPVPGATVRLDLGQGAKVALTGQQVVDVRLNEDGVGTLSGLRATQAKGFYAIKAVAAFGGETGEATLRDLSINVPFLSKRKKILIGVAGAAALAVVLVVKATAKPSVTISSSAPSGPVGPP